MFRLMTISTIPLFLLSCAAVTKKPEVDINKIVTEMNRASKKLCTQKLKPSDLKRKALKYQHPKYPRDAAIKGVNGCVVLSFNISDNGTPQNVKVLEAIPKDFGFEIAAKKSVLKTRYEKKAVLNHLVQLYFEVEK